MGTICHNGLHVGFLYQRHFSDSYLYRHQMNPALANTSSYLSIPVIGNINVGVGTNFGVKDLIYQKKDGSGIANRLRLSTNNSASMVSTMPNCTKTWILTIQYQAKMATTMVHSTSNGDASKTIWKIWPSSTYRHHALCAKE